MNRHKAIRTPSTNASSSSIPSGSILKSVSPWASKTLSPWSSAVTTRRVFISKKSPTSHPSRLSGASVSATNFSSVPTASGAGAAATISTSPKRPKSWTLASSTALSSIIKLTSLRVTPRMASSIPSASSPSKTTATTFRPTTPFPSSANLLSRDSPSFVPPSPISPVSSPPLTSATSTTPWTHSIRMSLLSFAPSGPHAASSSPRPRSTQKPFYRPNPNWLTKNGTFDPANPLILHYLSGIYWFTATQTRTAGARTLLTARVPNAGFALCDSDSRTRHWIDFGETGQRRRP